MPDPVLERFHRALIEEIQTQRPEYLSAPFTVAEIYQNLVPYGSHRDRIGVEMNGDYEDALIRLLAGEGGYLILDSPPALRDLRAELERQNPNTGLYREFAAVDVRLNQAYLDLSASALDQLPDLVDEFESGDPVTMAALAPSERAFSTSSLGIVPPGVDIFAAAEMSSSDHSVSKGPKAGAESDPPVGGRSSASRPPLEPEFVEDPVDTGMEDRASGARSGEPSLRGTGAATVMGGVRAMGPDGACLWCREDLPVRDKLNFCPFCGTDLQLVPCASCGDEIEPGWRFCASCGTAVDGAGD
jgi:hypothetical protein